MNYEKTLNLIYSNEVIMSELKKLFEEVTGESIPSVHGQNDDTLGQEYRAYCKAKEIIDDAFAKLQSFDSAHRGTSSIRYK